MLKIAENTKQFSLTKNAATRIKFLLDQEGKKCFFRLRVNGGGCSGFQYDFSFDEKKNNDDVIFKFNTKGGLLNEVKLKGYSNHKGESLFIVKDGNDYKNKLSVKIENIEFEGNVKNFYASLNSGSKIKFSVANAIDTSEIEASSQIELGFDTSKSIILPKGALATE